MLEEVVVESPIKLDVRAFFEEDAAAALAALAILAHALLFATTPGPQIGITVSMIGMTPGVVPFDVAVFSGQVVVGLVPGMPPKQLAVAVNPKLSVQTEFTAVLAFPAAVNGTAVIYVSVPQVVESNPPNGSPRQQTISER